MFAALALWACITSRAAGLVLRNSTQSSVQQKDQEKASNKRMHACLNEKRIVFIGPSTSKMDYLALAFFAEYGFWPDQEQVLWGVPGQPPQWGINPLNEGGIPFAPLPAWVTQPASKPGCMASGQEETTFRYTNALFNGHETCDCYEFGKWAGAYDMYNSTENRIYRNGNTMISYYQWFGDIVAPRGTFDLSPLLGHPVTPAAQQCPVGQFPGKWAWTMPAPKFLRDVIRWSKPTHLVVSTAFWPVTPTNTAFWDDLADAGVQAVMDSGGQVIWRTSPQRTGSHSHVSPRVDMTNFVKKGWKIFPAQQIVSQYKAWQPDDAIFYDFAHLRPASQCILLQSFLQTHVCPGDVSVR